jgi:hypothetical protein
MNETLLTLLKSLVEIVRRHEGRLVTLEEDQTGESVDEANLMEELTSLVSQLPGAQM